jgi:hypothetical protein
MLRLLPLVVPWKVLLPTSVVVWEMPLTSEVAWERFLLLLVWKQFLLMPL